MLQEWLEELAEDEMKKTASSQFEEVLQQMDIPELVAFYEMNNGLEKDALSFGGVRGAVDDAVLRARQLAEPGALKATIGDKLDPAISAIREGVSERLTPEQAIQVAQSGLASGAGGAAAGGLTGGAMGAARGALEAEPGSRLEAAGRGALSGAGTGAAIGGIGGGLGGAIAGGVHPAGSVSPGLAAGAGAFGGGMGGLMGGAAAGEDVADAIKQRKLMEAKTAAKVKQASDTGKALAHMGFLPKVIQPTFGKTAAAPQYTEGEDGVMQKRRLRDTMFRHSGMVGPQMALDPAKRQEQYMAATEHHPLASGIVGGIGGGLLGAGLGGMAKGVPGAIAGGLGGAAVMGGADYGLSQLARKLNKGRVAEEAGKDLARYQAMKAQEEEGQKLASFVQGLRTAGKAVKEGLGAEGVAGAARAAAGQAKYNPEVQKALAGTAAGGAALTAGGLGIKALSKGKKKKKTEEESKTASFRDTIMKVAAQGALPQHHGWEIG